MLPSCFERIYEIMCITPLQQQSITLASNYILNQYETPISLPISFSISLASRFVSNSTAPEPFERELLPRPAGVVPFALTLLSRA